MTAQKLETPVVVAVDECYCNDNGAYQTAYLWDGEKVFTDGGRYYRGPHFTVNCDPEQFKAAVEWQRENTPYTIPYNKYCYNRLGAHTYIGCIVKLKRSRLAPNGVPLKVVEFFESYYDKNYDQRVDEKFSVTDGTVTWKVSTNCLAEVVQGVKEYVYWADNQ